MASVYTEADYRISLATGLIPPPIRSSAPPKFARKKPDYVEIAREEFVRGIYRKLGERTLEAQNPEIINKMSADLLAQTNIDLSKI
jgi:hypothetical protein